MQFRWPSIVALMGLLVFAFFSDLSAQTYGKLTGRVIDAETKDPLPGAAIEIPDLNIGTVSDVDGYYVILNVPPGTYDVKASMLGYNPVTVKGVRIDAGRTTELNFSLTPTVIKVGEVVVIAERPVIKKDLTASVSIIESEEMKQLPVANVGQVVTQQAGVLERGGLIVRGGRPDEVVYVIDGAEVRDPYYGTTDIEVPLEAIEETSINKGGFGAEYGTVSSGVINIVTKEGRDRYELTVRGRTGDFSALGSLGEWLDADPSDPYYRLLTGEKEVHKERLNRLEIGLGGPLIPNMKNPPRFYFSADIQRDKGRFPHQDDSRNNFQWKLTWSPVSNIKLFTSGVWFARNYQVYSPSWRLFLEGLPDREQLSRQFVFGINHLVSDKTYWELRVSNFETSLKWDVFEDANGDGIDDFSDFDHDTYSDYSRAYLEFIGLNVDSLQELGLVKDIFTYNGAEYVELWYHTWETAGQGYYPSFALGQREVLDFWVVETPAGDTIRDVIALIVQDGDSLGITYDQDTVEIARVIEEIGNQYTRNPLVNYYRTPHHWDKGQTFQIRWDWVSQVTPNHQLKAGIEYKTHTLYQYDIDYVSQIYTEVVGIRPDVERTAFDPDSELYEFVEVHPKNFAAYIQDKMEFGGIIGNVGFRFDYFDPAAYYPADWLDPVYNPFQGGRIKNPVKAKPYWYISPRIGISHPISERDVLHFTYGHYFQVPTFRHLYENLNHFYATGGFPRVGNPSLKPQKTISYEVGVKHAFNRFLVLDVTGFYKDISDLVQSRMLQIAGGARQVTTFFNEDYASVRGLEFSLDKRPGGTFLPDLSFSIRYTFQVARGSFSSPFEGYITQWRGYPLPEEEHPLNWDRRHSLTVNLIYTVPQDKRIFGIPGTEGLSFSVVHTSGSGYPWTPTIRSDRDALEKINSERFPATHQTDLRIAKSFKIGPVAFQAFANIYNLFNRRNLLSINDVQWYEQFGDPEGEVRDPTVWSRGRYTRIGIELKWEQL